MDKNILEAGSGARPWTIEDLSVLAWRKFENKYPKETKDITDNEAVEVLKSRAVDLLIENKLEQVCWTRDTEGMPVFSTIR